jgi:asparagine synthase (glutamine-hydrolysing)
VEPAALSELFAAPCDPEEVYSEAIQAWEEAASPDLVDKTLEFYAKLYLQDDILTKVDRASMLCSLEVRAPFLDAEVVDLARRIPHRFKFRGGVGKYILKKALEPLLPADILNRKKKGFGAPVGQWFKQGRLTLSGGRIPSGLDARFIARMERQHLEGRADHRLLLWNLWVLGRRPAGGAA